MNSIHVLISDNTGLDVPDIANALTHIVQRPRRSAGLAFCFGVEGSLKTLREDVHRDHKADRNTNNRQNPGPDSTNEQTKQ